MSNCCKICENLPINNTSNEYVLENRKKAKRFNEKYTEEEIENIWNVLLDSYNPNEKIIKQKDVYLPIYMHKCLDTLIEKSGRPRRGFVSKLTKLHILQLGKYETYFSNKMFYNLELSTTFYKKLLERKGTENEKRPV